jgi:hypothetical protein
MRRSAAIVGVGLLVLLVTAPAFGQADGWRVLPSAPPVPAIVPAGQIVSTESTPARTRYVFRVPKLAAGAVVPLLDPGRDVSLTVGGRGVRVRVASRTLNAYADGATRYALDADPALPNVLEASVLQPAIFTWWTTAPKPAP